ncbi:hypothetical protein GOP47_0004265 [Adiantum capillus-veneris]|uniref:Uncharacterized protein n=1 Tax=Adiantum capillus-veneris TaxID=13818 RepID=A0A9D4ZPE4_ADICA|nr:hypothetical protein GOP47_0004265 [Adiantum capillus-veneris]
MDPETEKHFAALIMEEATRLRLQAEKEGVHAYLAKPRVRGKPNPQFLKATVRSIAQANRAAEVNGMWKCRAREIELEERERKKSRHRHKSDSSSRYLDRGSYNTHCQQKNMSNKSRIEYRELSPSPMSHNNREVDRVLDNYCSDMPQYGDEDLAQDFEDQGLKEEEIEYFLQSRVKRGRGTVGSRMDETGPYPSAQSGLADDSIVRVKEEWEQRIIGPSREVLDRQLVLDSKSMDKKQKMKEAEECSGDASRRKVKKKEKREKKKRKHSLKKSKKRSDNV